MPLCVTSAVGLKQQCGSLQCAAFSVYSLGRCIIFAKDFIEHERKQDSEHTPKVEHAQLLKCIIWAGHRTVSAV